MGAVEGDLHFPCVKLLESLEAKHTLGTDTRPEELVRGALKTIESLARRRQVSAADHLHFAFHAANLTLTDLPRQPVRSGSLGFSRLEHLGADIAEEFNPGEIGGLGRCNLAGTSQGEELIRRFVRVLANPAGGEAS